MDKLTAPSASVNLSQAPSDPQGIPSRSEERPGTLLDLPDEALWNLIVAADSQAVVGLKAPGRARGIYEGRILVNPVEKSNARAAVLGPDVVLVSADTLMPRMTVRIADQAALGRIRKLPFVDYVEPLAVRQPNMWASDGLTGCTQPAVESGYTIDNGDILPDIYVKMDLPRAWTWSNGRGVTMGLTDTGIFSTQSELLSQFATGQSAGRTIQTYGVNYYSQYGDCSHGTRMAGVMAAPKMGRTLSVWRGEPT